MIDPYNPIKTSKSRRKDKKYLSVSLSRRSEGTKLVYLLIQSIKIGLCRNVISTWGRGHQINRNKRNIEAHYYTYNLDEWTCGEPQ